MPSIRALVRLPTLFGRNTSQELFTSLHTRFGFSKAIGYGVLPLWHHTKLGESRRLRGYSAGGSGDLEERTAAHAICQTDLYFGDFLGLFMDGGAFVGDTANAKVRKALCIGLSMRAKGLRLDCGIPLDKRITLSTISAARVHLGLDNIHF